MATLAADNTRVNKAAAAAPISAHPAFPAIVALWFAALLGLGSLILPTVLLERLATVTGIASLVPSAAPPLGFTARATIAIAAAFAGAVLGLVLARQVAKGREPRLRARFDSDDLPRCRPISAHDELGEEGLGAPAPRAAGVKRRSLAIAEDSGPSPYLQAVPLPGHETAATETAEDDADEPLELGAFAEQSGAEAAHDDQDFSMTDEVESDLPNEAIAPTGRRQEFGTRSEAGATLPRAFDPLPQSEAETDDEAPSLEALPFSAPSLRRMAPATGVDGEQDSDEAFSADIGEAAAPIPQAFEPPADAPRLTVVESASEDDCAATDPSDDDRPHEELGLVQLATRLGALIESRRAQRAAQSDGSRAGRTVFTAEEDFDAAQAEDAARARADFFGGGSQPGDTPAFERAPAGTAGRPSPLGELEFDEEDDFEDLSDSFSLPLRTRSEAVDAKRAGAALAADESEEESDDPTAEHEYTSLLAMKNPFRKEDEFVRVEVPEPEENDMEATVTFPERKTEQPAASPSPARPFDPPGKGAGNAPADRPRTDGDAERELRAALETLQRMSGTA